jgi:ABC-type uncharacterized transport system permease subunit
LDTEFVVLLVAAGVRLAIPLLICGLGEVFAERSGVINVGLEGMMLFGAFFAYFGALVTNNPIIGLLAGMVAGIMVSLIFGYFTVSLGLNQVVTAVGINILALGVTTYSARLVGTGITVPGFPEYHIPLLYQIPVVGEILFGQSILAYVGLLMVPLLMFVLYKTTLGLRIRAVGEDPLAASTVGVNVKRTRFIGVVFGGLMAGFAGAYLPLAYLSTFSENMTGGRGYIALACVILGTWDPLKLLGATLLFGLVDAFSFRIQTTGLLPTSAFPFLVMLPYVLALVVLIGVARRAAGPKSLGKPYKGPEE